MLLCIQRAVEMECWRQTDDIVCSEARADALAENGDDMNPAVKQQLADATKKVRVRVYLGV